MKFLIGLGVVGLILVFAYATFGIRDLNNKGINVGQVEAVKAILQATITPTTAIGGSAANEIVNVNAMFLTVNSPSDLAIVTNNKLTIKGVTVPGVSIYANESESKSDTKGNFSVAVSLDDGENYISVLAVDDFGNSAQKDLTIVLE